jgi:Lon protease-like protein
MVADAAASDRMIGMVLLRPGWEHDYEGRPAVYPVGCSGLMTHVERLPDGRYNIVLRGVERFRIVEEDLNRSYRRALVEAMPEREPGPEDLGAIRLVRSRLESLVASSVERPCPGNDSRIPSGMPDEDLVNALAQYLDLEPLEKLLLLERPSLRARAESLVELLEMKVMMARMPGVPHVAH